MEINIFLFLASLVYSRDQFLAYLAQKFRFKDFFFLVEKIVADMW